MKTFNNLLSKKWMRRTRTIVMVAALSTLASGVLAQTKWDMPTGYGINSFQTENIVQFTQDVEKATKGALKIVVHPGASLFKANEIKRAVQTGQAEAGEFILSGASNENPLFGLDAVPFLATNYQSAWKLWQVSKPAMDKLLESQGMKLLFTGPWPGQSLYSTKAIAKPEDIQGTKMRAYNPASSRVAVLLGAQPVTIQLAELAQALATGAVDNFLTSSASGVENKLYEQAKFFYTVDAWMPKNAVVVNKKSFDALSPAIQAEVLKAAAEAEKRVWKNSEAKNQEYLKDLAKNGMKIDAPSKALEKRLQEIGEIMTNEWLTTAGAEGKAIIEAYRKP